MKTREGPRLSVRRHPDVLVITDGENAPSSGPDVPVLRRKWAVLLLGILVVAAAAALVLAWLSAGDGDVSTASPARPVSGSGEPAALSVSVDAPETVLAGREAAFVLRWTDGAGTFAGTTEDWGDGVGVGSVAVGSCTSAGPTGAGSGTVRLPHTWAKPGTYTVVLTATTTTCRDGQAVTEDASQSITVTVARR